MTSTFTRLRISLILLFILFNFKSYSYPLQPATTTILLPTSTLSSRQTLDVQQNIAFLDLTNKEKEDDEDDLRDIIEQARDEARREKERQLRREREHENREREREERERERQRERDRKEKERKDREQAERHRAERERERQEREREEREREEREREREREHRHDNSANDDNSSASSSSSSTSKSNTYGQHQQKSDDDSENDDSTASSSSPATSTTATPTSNTIVTTVVIISTETPTSIYSVSGNNPSKQKSGNSANHQISDPNSSSTSSSDGEESSALPAAVNQGRSRHHKLVIALSVVGGFAGIALIAGLFIVTRMQLKKRKRKQQIKLDEESGHPNNDPPSNFTPRHNLIAPPPNARLSTVSTDSEIPVITNPFSDPTDDIAMPSAPPPAALSINLDPYVNNDYQPNRRLSLLSQTTATAEPSAPTAKELDAMYDNPFEEEYGQEQDDSDYHPMSSAPHPSVNDSLEIHQSPQLLMRQQSVRPQNNYSSQSNYNNFPPPPAYTPSAPPSAPPLYALPTTGVALEQEESSSRRHSISSCSMISLTRPLSLRRGSGTLAHINSPFT